MALAKCFLTACSTVVFVAVALSRVHGVSVTSTISIDLSRTHKGFVYDGHGGVSAGASSRLLFDYPEPQRSQVLDYLFKPQWGAAAHHLKVEIGGDSQSTDGTETSHMHSRNDLDCNRGYEFWLLREARRRNPDIVMSALSWTIPAWVGNDTYFSADNIKYHVEWLKCATKDPAVGKIDFMGIWNEHPWGTVDWVKQFRGAMDAAGFGHTQIILGDGLQFDPNWLVEMNKDANFSKAVAGFGLHYPCLTNQNLPHRGATSAGKKLWSSEESSTLAGWPGAGCIGRSLNQNFVRMNMTATLAWSLIWSVYGDLSWPCSGKSPDDGSQSGPGLMRAMQPWSGYYTVDPGIWMLAHTGQFTKPGWKYVPGASGLLPKGGSYVTLAAPDASEFTVVIEKLEGNCQYCHAESQTETEAVHLQMLGWDDSIVGKLLDGEIKTLQLWASNSTKQFQRQADVILMNGNSVPVIVRKDSIITISTITTARHGSFAPTLTPASFPLPFMEDFESRPPGSFAKYFADNGGVFEIAADPTGWSTGQVLQQMVIQQAERNLWTSNVPPITIVGGFNWSDVTVAAAVYLPSQWATLGTLTAIGVCQRAQGGHGGGKGLGGLCLQMFGNGTWALGDRAGLSLKTGAIEGKVVGQWRVLSLAITADGSVTASIDSIVVASGVTAWGGNGRVALVSGFHTAFYDNVTVHLTAMHPNGGLVMYI